MLTVIGPRGGRTFRVLWTLEELRLAYKIEDARPHSKGMYAVNPLGQAPALRDGGTILTDSLAIVHYLAERVGALTFPGGTPERALMDARINFVLTELEAPIWLMARHGFVLPEAERVPGMRAVAEADFARAEQKFEILLAGNEFFGGDVFTLADIFATDLARWAAQAKIELSSESFRNYATRMMARPAWTQTLKAMA
ncbi:MAG: glutathione S-transferase family protein [Pseudomonadota bacterium]